MILLFEENTTEFYTESPSGEIVSYHLGIGSLNDATSCLIKEELNGGYELEMEYPISGSHYSDIKHDRIIFTEPNRYDKPQAFRIYKISKPYNGIVTINAAHISYDLNKYTIKEIDAQNIDAAFAQFNTNNVFGNEQKQFIFTKRGDGYTDNKIKFDTPINIRSVLLGEEGSILDIYGGGYSFDNFKVTHHKNGRGTKKGISIKYGKNLTDITEDTDNNNAYTHLFPFYRKEVVETSFPESRVYDTFYIFDDSKRYTKEWLCDENALTPDGIPKSSDAGGAPSTFDAAQYNTRSVKIDTKKGDPEKDLGSFINGLYTYGMSIPAYINNNLPTNLNGRGFQPLNKILLRNGDVYSWPKIIRATDIEISQDGRITITKLGDVFTVKSGTGISASYNHWVWVGSLPGEEDGDLDSDDNIAYRTEEGETVTEAGYEPDPDNPRGFTLLANVLGTQKEPSSRYDEVGRGFWSISAYDAYITSSDFPATNSGISFKPDGSDTVKPKNYGGSFFHIVKDLTGNKGDYVGNFYYFDPTKNYQQGIAAYISITPIDSNNNKVLYPQWISFESKTNTHIDSLNLIYDKKVKTVEGKTRSDDDWLVDEDDNPITPENNKKYFIIEDVNETDILSYKNTLVSYETENGYVKISDIDENGLCNVLSINSEIQNGLIKVGSLDLTDEFDELPTPRELSNACKNYITKNKIGVITKNITLDMVTLSQTEEYSFLKTSDDIELGDYIQVIHGPLKIYSSDERVISLTYDSIHKIYTEIELGEKKKSTATNTLTKGSGVSELKNDSDYASAQEAADMIFKSVQAKEGRFSSADIKFLTSEEIIATLVNASVANIDSVVAEKLTAENAEISNALKAGSVQVKGDIEATNIIAKESGQIAGLTIKQESRYVGYTDSEGTEIKTPGISLCTNPDATDPSIRAFDLFIYNDTQYGTQFLFNTNKLGILNPQFSDDAEVTLKKANINFSINTGYFEIIGSRFRDTQNDRNIIDFFGWHGGAQGTAAIGRAENTYGSISITLTNKPEHDVRFNIRYKYRRETVYKTVIWEKDYPYTTQVFEVEEDAGIFRHISDVGFNVGGSSEPASTVYYIYSDGAYSIDTYLDIVPRGNLRTGTPDSKWVHVYAENLHGHIDVGSDRALKKDISYDMTKFDKFFDSLKPASFKYKDGTSGRDHIGFIAQDVKQAMDENDISTSEFAGYCEEHIDKEDENVVQRSLRYDEFIAILVDQVQTLKKEVQELKTELSKK